MVTVICRTCGTEYELIFEHPAESAWCSEICRAEFVRAVKHLAADGDPTEIGVDPGSRLFCEAIKEVQALRRLEMVERRDLREREWQRSKPQRLKPLYPV
jgi:hypothetical protein